MEGTIQLQTIRAMMTGPDAAARLSAAREEMVVQVRSIAPDDCRHRLVREEMGNIEYRYQLECEHGLLAESSQRLRHENEIFNQQVANARSEHYHVRDELESAIQNARAEAMSETQQLNASISHVQAEGQRLAQEGLETQVLQQRLATEYQERQTNEQLHAQRVGLLEQRTQDQEARLAAMSRQRDSAEQQLSQLRTTTTTTRMRLEALEHQEAAQSRCAAFSEQSAEQAQELQHLAKKQKLIGEMDAVRSECSNLILQHASMQSELLEAQKCIEMLADGQQPEEGFQERVERFREELHTTRAELVAMSAEPARLRQELLQSQDALHGAKDEAQQFARQVKVLQDEWREWEACDGAAQDDEEDEREGAAGVWQSPPARTSTEPYGQQPREPPTLSTPTAAATIPSFATTIAGASMPSFTTAATGATMPSFTTSATGATMPSFTTATTGTSMPRPIPVSVPPGLDAPSSSSTDGRFDKLADMIQVLSESVAGLASSAIAQQAHAATTASTQQELLQRLTEAANDNRKALKADKPKLSAVDPATLHTELKAYRRYMNDNKFPEKVYWFTGARSIATDRARVCIESYIIGAFVSEENYQRAVDAKDPELWMHHWSAFERRLKMDTGLDDSSELNEVVRVYGRVSLNKSGGVDAVDKFIQDYQDARTRMLETGLLFNGDAKSTIRELEDLRTKTEGSDLWNFRSFRQKSMIPTR